MRDRERGDKFVGSRGSCRFTMPESEQLDSNARAHISRQEGAETRTEYIASRRGIFGQDANSIQ